MKKITIKKLRLKANKFYEAATKTLKEKYEIDKAIYVFASLKDFYPEGKRKKRTPKKIKRKKKRKK